MLKLKRKVIHSKQHSSKEKWKRLRCKTTVWWMQWTSTHNSNLYLQHALRTQFSKGTRVNSISTIQRISLWWRIKRGNRLFKDNKCFTTTKYSILKEQNSHHILREQCTRLSLFLLQHLECQESQFNNRSRCPDSTICQFKTRSHCQDSQILYKCNSRCLCQPNQWHNQGCLEFQWSKFNTSLPPLPLTTPSTKLHHWITLSSLWPNTTCKVQCQPNSINSQPVANCHQ